MRFSGKKGFFVHFLLILLACMLCGCASVPKEGAFPYQTFSINNIPYFAVVNMCEKEQVAWDFDPLSQVVILKKDNKEWKILVGSNRILTGDTFIDLGAPVVLKEGVVYAPADLRRHILPLPCKLPEVVAVPKVPVYLKTIGTVILDAGHGGKDPGAVGRYGLKEKDVVLDVARRIKGELERCGLNVYLTRERDEFIVLSNRPKVAQDKKGDLFISIHANANRSRWIEGFEVYYLSENVDDDARALAAAENTPLALDDKDFSFSASSLKAMLWDMIYTENRKESIELARQICYTVSRKMNLKLRGVKGANFAVLRGSYVPSVLVEIGYISNKEGEKKLRDSVYRQRMAEAIAGGIMNFKLYAEGNK